MLLFLGGLVVVLGGALVATLVAHARSEASPAPVPASNPPFDDGPIRSILAGYDRQLEQITLAVAEGISNVKRAENRINATIGRARREFADRGFESPALEAEYGELHAVDGELGKGGELPEVPKLLVPPADEDGEKPSAVPGMTNDELAAYKSRSG